MLFGLTRPLRVAARLRSSASASATASEGADAEAIAAAAALEATMRSCVVARAVADREARIEVHAPFAGEFTLEVYTAPRDGGLATLAWQYLLIADAQSPVRCVALRFFLRSLVSTSTVPESASLSICSLFPMEI